MSITRLINRVGFKLDKVFQIRNEKAWAAIEAEKKVQAKLKKEAGLDRPCCAISEDQMNLHMMLDELSNEMLHVLPKGREVEYLSEVMVAINIGLTQLMTEFTT